MKWTQQEKDDLLQHVWASDDETVDAQIEHAMYQMYEVGEYKMRSHSACKSMLYKELKIKRHEAERHNDSKYF